MKNYDEIIKSANDTMMQLHQNILELHEKIEYYEDMLEEEAINKYLNMIANDYSGELAKIFEEKYINKDKEIERLNNIINELEKWLKEEYEATIFDYHNAIEDVLNKLQELKES